MVEIVPPKLSFAERFNKVQELLGNYGTATKIPEEVLETLGYVLIQLPEGGTKLMPIERASAQKIVQKEMVMTVDKTPPFDEIRATYNGRRANYRFIAGEQFDKLESMYKRLHFIDYFDSEYNLSLVDYLLKHNPSSPLITFFRDFEKYSMSAYSQGIEGAGEDMGQKVAEKIFIWSTVVPILGYLTDRIEKKNLDKYSLWNEDKGNHLTRVKSEEFFDDLDRMQGAANDITEITRVYHKALFERVIDEEESDQDITKFICEIGINTRFELIRYCFTDYLRSIGQTEAGNQLAAAADIQTAISCLKSHDFAEALAKEEMSIKLQLKGVEAKQRVELNSRLKIIQEEIKKVRKIKMGILQIFELPELLSRVCSSAVSDVQELLKVGKNDDEEHESILWLDAKPDTKLDADPGVISGDCTKGMPLPFEIPEMPIFNVKVYDQSRRHIGNMYLLETEEVSEGSKTRKVWHFDAIQIPRSTINWDQAVENIITSLAQEAEIKGIDLITVNNSDEQISNYDFIQKAIGDYWKNNGSRLVQIDMYHSMELPKGKIYSRCQGDGEVRVLWQRSEKS